MGRHALTVMLFALFTSWPLAANAQFFALCREGSEAELEANAPEHAAHTYRMMDKLAHGVYKQDPLPSDAPVATLADVKSFLQRLPPVGAAHGKVGVLYQAYSEGGGLLCTWLISRQGVVSDVVAVGREEHEGLRLQLLAVGPPVDDHRVSGRGSGAGCHRPLHGLPRREYERVLATFSSVFPPLLT